MKTESYSCPVKDCPFIWVPGMHVGQPPAILVKPGKRDFMSFRKFLGCPTHQVGLVKNTERQRIEPYKGTPRMQKVKIVRK